MATGDSRADGSPCGGPRGGRRSAADSSSTYSFRSCVDPDDDDSGAGLPGGGLGRAASSSALSELLEGLRKRRAGGDAGTCGDASSAVSLPVFQTTAASALRRRASALSVASGELPEARPGILKPSSPLLPRSASARSAGDVPTAASSATPSRLNSCDSAVPLPSLPRLSSLASSHVARQHPPTRHASAERSPTQCLPSLAIPEENWEEPQRSVSTLQRSPQAPRRCTLGSFLSEDVSEGSLAPEGAVFQSRRLLGESDAASVASDVLPAIRRAQSAGSLAGSVRGGRRALSVHFGELPPSTRRRRGSDTESSGSGGSAGSCEPTRPRRRSDRLRGERLEAEGSEGGEGGEGDSDGGNEDVSGDVASVMRKYLNKEIN